MELFAVAAVVGVAAAIQSLAGFGFALISVPLMSLTIDTKEAVVVSAVLGLITSTAQAIAERHACVWPTVRRMFVGALIGSPIGLLVLEVASERSLRLALAVAIVGFLVISLRGLTLGAHSHRADVVAGGVAGLLNTSLSTNGPPLVMVLHAKNLEPPAFRATISTVFATSGVIAVTLFAIAGRFDRDAGIRLSVSLPALLIGLFAGISSRRFVDQRWFRPLVLGLLAITAAISVATAL